jgi:hypothetical protein
MLGMVSLAFDVLIRSVFSLLMRVVCREEGWWMRPWRQTIWDLRFRGEDKGVVLKDEQRVLVNG